MIGQSVTLVRVKPGATVPYGHSIAERFTIRGVIMDVTEDAEGTVTGVHIKGERAETGEPRDSWYAVGPNALDGNVCTEQTATLDACGCPVTDQCACDLRRTAN